MSGISRLLAKELSSALGITDNAKFNPVFKRTDEVMTDVADPDSPTVARFYSPLEGAIENAPISETKGTKGENIEAFVRKRAPKVSKGELDFRDFKLDPEARYTSGQALDESTIEPLEIGAFRKKPKYPNTQRQNDLVDRQVGYEELGVDVTNKELGLQTHFGPSNLAHTRYSLRQERGAPDESGIPTIRFDEDADYLLIEELQSDAIQNMSDNPAKIIEDATDEYRAEFKSAMDDIAFKPEFDAPGDLFEDFEDFVFNKYLPIRTDKKLSASEADEAMVDVFKKAGLDNIAEDQRANPLALKTYFNEMAKNKLDVYDWPGKDNILGLITDEANDVINKAKSTVGKKDTPLTSLTDSVRVLLQSIMADAKAKGVDEIVLPPIEKLAARRFPLGSTQYNKAISKGSGFHNTYVVAYDKAVKQLKAELGNQIKLGTKQLEYDGYRNEKKLTEKFNAKTINIKNLNLDPTKEKLRFNTGGLVQRRTK
jgi:hypothetical protein